jgi:SAM-dependent methyltransferase
MPIDRKRGAGRVLARVADVLDHAGLNLGRGVRALRGTVPYVRDLARYSRSASDPRFPIRIHGLLPVFKDRHGFAGETRYPYFHQDLWAARKIFAARPARHVDVGSRIDGFVAHLLTFMPVELIDIRPLANRVEGLTVVCDDATTLRQYEDASVESLSSLHAVEHFGLGRYGDPIQPDAWRIAMQSLARVLAPGGRLYFSVPIGRERLRFNAHRIFAPATVLETFGSLRLLSFSAVNESGDLDSDADPNDYANASFATGLFEFTR